MIINRRYFKGDIYISNLTDDVLDTVLDTKSDIDAFLLEYERNCLDLVLGNVLSLKFISQLDDTQPNGLKVGADAKWNDLLNGKSYQVNGKNVYWRGIRFANVPTNTPDMSFVAEYVYFHYLKKDQSNYSGVGLQSEQPKNSIKVNATAKAVTAWRKFYNRVQGSYMNPKIISNSIGYGVMWNGSETARTLYQFISDINAKTPDTYTDFEPFLFNNINEFGI